MKKMPALPLWLLGLLEALQALVITLLVVVISVAIFAFAANGWDLSIATIAELSAQGFAVIHAAPLHLGDGSWFHLVPLALVAIPVALCWRVGSRIARGAFPEELWQALVGFCVMYLVGSVALVQVVLADIGTSVWTGVAVVMISVGGFIGGCYTAAGNLSRLLGIDFEATIEAVSQRMKWLGAYLLSAGRGAVVAAVAVIGFNAVLLAGWLLWEWMDIANEYQRMQPGLSGVFALSLIQLALVPNFVVWTAAFTSGVGFSLGATSITPFGAAAADLLDVPVVAALPTEVHAGWVVLIPVFAGIVAGWWLMRDGENHLDDWFQLKVHVRAGSLAASTAALGLITGIFTAVLLLLPFWLSRISLGIGQWVDIGPHAGLAALSVGGWVAIGVVAGYLLGQVRWRRRRAGAAAEPFEAESAKAKPSTGELAEVESVEVDSVREKSPGGRPAQKPKTPPRYRRSRRAASEATQEETVHGEATQHEDDLN